MDNICRICLTACNNSSSNLNETVANGRNIVETLTFVSGLEINLNEKFPKKICSKCLEKLLEASSFKEKIVAAELVLKIGLKDEVRAKVDKLSVDQDRACLTASEANPKLRKIKAPKAIDFVCQICNTTFDKVRLKNEHVKTEHQNEKFCKVCNKSCKTPFSLEAHIKDHFEVPNFMCELCSETFRYRSWFNYHMIRHHSPVRYDCDLCLFSTKFKRKIQHHMKSVHMELKLFKCEKCPDREYPTRDGLNIHLYRYHDAPAPVKCSSCNQGFELKCELRSHTKRACPKLKNPTTESEEIFRPSYFQETDDTGELTCKLCAEKFPIKETAKIHNNLKHRGSNKCVICKVVLKRRSVLTRPEKEVHLGIKPYKCEFCSKTFGQKVSLECHRYYHTKEKPFSCTYCDFKTRYNSSLTRHNLTIHPNEFPLKLQNN